MYILSLFVFSLLKFNMASNSRKLEFTAAVRGFCIFRKKWKPALNEKLHCLQEPGNNYNVFSIKTRKSDKTEPNGGLSSKRDITAYQIFAWPWCQNSCWDWKFSLPEISFNKRGIGIRYKVFAFLPGTIKNLMLLDGYKKLVNKLYCEPKNEVIIGNFLTSVSNENIYLNQPEQ